jgi:hypothetical protein
MIRFVCWVISIGLAICFGPKLLTVNAAMAKSAIVAHQRDPPEAHQHSTPRFRQSLQLKLNHRTVFAYFTAFSSKSKYRNIFKYLSKIELDSKRTRISSNSLVAIGSSLVIHFV